MLRSTCNGPKATMEGTLMDAPSKEFALAGSLEELKIKGRLVVHGGHRPIRIGLTAKVRDLITTSTLRTPRSLRPR